MTDCSVSVISLGRNFGRMKLFSGLNLSVVQGDSIAILGPNGSGKTTLIRILAGLQEASSGTVRYTVDGNDIKRDRLRSVLSCAAPFINPYDELTGEENILFVMNDPSKAARMRELIEHFGMARYAARSVSHYSSGMKQRLKLALALVNDPLMLLLDEPSTNLDADGFSRLVTAINGIRTRTCLFIATNDERESALCARNIRLG